jgi:hypothetical protein
MTKGVGLLVSAVFLVAAVVGQAEARTRALIVGAAGYPNLAEKLRLTGPRNDTREFANTLARLGAAAPSDITVLADGVKDLADGINYPGPANKAAILGALDRLAEDSQPGDLVVFYFSGHGSQQTDFNGDEEGGLDEVFLPYDVGKWGDNGIENALVDDELDAPIRRMLEKGIDFFGVIDACHSATGFRDVADQDSRVREVDPAELGAPAGVAAPEPKHFAFASETRAGTRGRAAFFYAAQEGEGALERKPDGGDTDESFGVFTYNLLKRINQTPALTYRTLHQAVVDDIKRGNLMATQTPEMEGELLDQPVLRLASNVEPLRQWRTYSGTLLAGELNGVTRGSLLGIYQDAADADDKAVAYAVVDSAGATRSTISQVVHPCPAADAAGNCTAMPDEAAFRKGRFARIVEPGVDFSLTLSEPIRLDRNDGQDYGPAIAALRSAVNGKGLSSRVSLRSSGYDIAVGLIDGKLVFAPEAGLIDRDGKGSSPRLTLPADPAAARATVAEAITRMAKVLALQRLRAAEFASPVGLRTRTLRLKAGPGAVGDGTCSQDADKFAAPAEATDETAFGDCDILSVEMANTGPKPIDVTVLLVAPDFSITTVWPREGDDNRIQLGETKTAAILQMEPDPKTASEERLIFLAVPGVSNSHVAFDNLDQEGLRAASGDETPGLAAARDLLATSLTDMSRAAAVQPERLDEEMAVAVRPFFVAKGEGD